MDLTNGNQQQNEATKLGSIKTDSRFAALAWSTGESSITTTTTTTTNNSKKYPMGMLAGGMENGTVHVWDPRTVIQQQQQTTPSTTTTTTAIASFSQHVSGPVKAVQFLSLIHILVKMQLLFQY